LFNQWHTLLEFRNRVQRFGQVRSRESRWIYFSEMLLALLGLESFEIG
jgi:hypothetical protein